MVLLSHEAYLRIIKILFNTVCRSRSISVPSDGPWLRHGGSRQLWDLPLTGNTTLGDGKSGGASSLVPLLLRLLRGSYICVPLFRVCGWPATRMLSRYCGGFCSSLRLVVCDHALYVHNLGSVTWCCSSCAFCVDVVIFSISIPPVSTSIAYVISRCRCPSYLW